MWLLLIKLTLAPGLVVATTLAGRRWGARAAGLLGGLPVIVGPILLALDLQHGDAFAARAAAGSLAGLVALTVFMLAYGWLARVTRWPGALLASWAAFAGATLALDHLVLPRGISLAVVLCAFALTAVLLPHRPEAAPSERPPRFDLLMRAAATAALVVTITAVSGALGPRLSGLLAAFPILSAVLSAFTHVQDGPDATAEFLRGLVIGLCAFAAFCFVVAELLPSAGLATSFLVASAVAVAVNALTSAGALRARRTVPATA